ncbi:MAG: hypothetical protein KKF68_01920 [Nanoarchaeota archaeon]|nr:hypothetical protein [Nanoarchaeota archaeon]
MIQANKNFLVIFDVGGIMVQLNYGNKGGFVEKASEIAGIPQRDFQLWHAQLEKKCLLGEVSAGEYYQLVREKLKNPQISQDDLKNLVGLLWEREIESTVCLKQRIHDAGYSIGLLSSMTDFALETLSKRHPKVFETWEGPKVYSFECGVIKPDLRIYGFFPEDTQKIFIDDNLRYVETPVKKLGWLGVHYTAHIDKSEGIRSIQEGDSQAKKYSHPNLRIANTPQELEESLRAFGVKI